MAEGGASGDDLKSMNVKKNWSWSKGPNENIAGDQAVTKNTGEMLLEFIESYRKRKSNRRSAKEEVVYYNFPGTSMLITKAILKGKVMGYDTEEKQICEGTSGRIFKVEVPAAQTVYIKKTVEIFKFRSNEIRVMVYLNSSKSEATAPALYAFSLDRESDNVVMQMEYLDGRTLAEAIRDEVFNKMDKKDRESFSFLILQSLLKTFKHLKEGGFTHNDMHEENVMIVLKAETIHVFTIDFGAAQHEDEIEPTEFVDNCKSDIVSILRMFLEVYAVTNALRCIKSSELKQALETKEAEETNEALETNDAERTNHLAQFQEYMATIPEGDYIFRFMRATFDDAVKDTPSFIERLEEKIPQGPDLEELLKRVEALMFPERYQNASGNPKADGGEKEGKTILDSPASAELDTSWKLKK